MELWDGWIRPQSPDRNGRRIWSESEWSCGQSNVDVGGFGGSLDRVGRVGSQVDRQKDRWVVVGIKGLRAQSDRMLSIGDGQTHVGVLKVCPKKEKMLGVRTELSDGWTDEVWSCRSWQMDRWVGRRWHTGQEMGGDRNNGAPGPVRWNAVPRR